MSDGFTEQDRRMLIETHTKVNIIQEHHAEKLADHEQRIRKGETFRNRVVGWAIGAGVLTATTAEAIKAKLGI